MGPNPKSDRYCWQEGLIPSYLISENGTVLDRNGAASRLGNGTQLFDLFLSCEREIIRRKLQQVSAGDYAKVEVAADPVGIKYALLILRPVAGFCRSDTDKPLNSYGLSDSEHPIRINATVVDISDIRARESAALNLNLMFQKVLDYLPFAVFWKDRNSVVMGCNQFVAKVSGFPSPKEVIGKSDYDLPWTRQEADFFRECDQRVIESNTPEINIIEPQRQADGKTAWLETNKIPFHNEANQVIGVIGTFQVVTEREEMKLELQSLNKELEQKVAKRTAELAGTQAKLLKAAHQAGMSEIAIGVIHNVGNVLNSINVSVEQVIDQLQQSKLDLVSKANELLQKNKHHLVEFLTHDERGRLLPSFFSEVSQALEYERAAITKEVRLIRERIDVIKRVIASQQHYARVSEVYEKVDLCELIDSAIGMEELELKKGSIHVERIYPERPLCTVQRNKLSHVLINLIKNAVEAVEERTLGSKQRPKPKLSIEVIAGPEILEIRVADNGVGIKPENFSKLFTFGFTTKPNGHGFGLHISAISIREMGGSLNAQSDGKNHGAVFTAILPR